MLVLEYETEEMVTLEIETEDSMLLPKENRPSRKRSHSPIDGFEGSSRNITGVMMINASIALGLNYYKVYLSQEELNRHLKEEEARYQTTKTLSRLLKSLTGGWRVRYPS